MIQSIVLFQTIPQRHSKSNMLLFIIHIIFQSFFMSAKPVYPRLTICFAVHIIPICCECTLCTPQSVERQIKRAKRRFYLLCKQSNPSCNTLQIYCAASSSETCCCVGRGRKRTKRGAHHSRHRAHTYRASTTRGKARIFPTIEIHQARDPERAARVNAIHQSQHTRFVFGCFFFASL